MPLRRTALVLGATLATAMGLAPAALAQDADPEAQLRADILGQMAQGPATAGAYVVDLTDGHVVVDDRSEARRATASLSKLWTTSTALLDMGPRTRLATRVLGDGHRAGTTWHGDLYLRGSGDFTFGTRSFARQAYGGGGTIEQLARGVRRAGITHVDGRVLGDSTLFTDNGGARFPLALCPDPLFGKTCPYGPAGSLERPLPNGPRTPISFDRGLVSATSVDGQQRPTRFAARALVRALAAQGVHVDGAAGAGRTPDGARVLATTRSPDVAKLIALVNPPSDNYAADILQRVLGARAGDGSRAGGARVIRRVIQDTFGLQPQVVTGSGERVSDQASPREFVGLLTGMRARPEGAAFARSLSQAGRNGTLKRFAGSVAEGRCQLKDGTRVDELPDTTLNMAGYCRSVSGRPFAFAVMMNGMPIEFVPPDKIESPAYALQDTIVKLLAGYTS